jgi:hypothetical protein
MEYWSGYGELEQKRGIRFFENGKHFEISIVKSKT